MLTHRTAAHVGLWRHISLTHAHCDPLAGKVGIYSINCPEFMLVIQGCNRSSSVLGTHKQDLLAGLMSVHVCCALLLSERRCPRPPVQIPALWCVSFTLADQAAAASIRSFCTSCQFAKPSGKAEHKAHDFNAYPPVIHLLSGELTCANLTQMHSMRFGLLLSRMCNGPKS